MIVFFGGRTGNNVKLYECNDHERIYYADFNSLYPFINKFGVYPVAHPKIYIGTEECAQIVGEKNDVTRVDGLIMLNILPPRNLYHAVLPQRIHNKLIFPLCRKCCEDLTDGECTHEDPRERMLHGTWVSLEIQKAVEMGYRVVRIYEIWQYAITRYNKETGEGGIFAEYINKFYQRKMEASGYPPQCTTDAEKDRYIQEVSRHEGIELERDEIKYNGARRSLMKQLCNSLWGIVAESENKGSVEYVTEPKRLMDLLTSAEVEVTAVLPVNEDILCVRWRYVKEAVQPLQTTNVVVAAFTTAQARLKLFEHMHALGERVFCITIPIAYSTSLIYKEWIPNYRQVRCSVI